MKFIHIADVHLGATPDISKPWGKDREREIWESFHRIVSLCNEEKVDLLLIAGDLFHRQPLVRELKEVDYAFRKLEGTEVVFIAGNHDYLGARSNYIAYPWNERVHMLSMDQMESVYFPQWNTEVYGFSYHKRDIMEPLYDYVKPNANDRKKVLLAHGGDEKNIPINKGRLKELGFDYIALGHIHKHEIINKGAAYAGSLEPLDRNELGEHGYIMGEITSENEELFDHTKIQFHPYSLRRYHRIVLKVEESTTNGELLDQVKAQILAHGKQNIYQFIIRGFRGEDIHFDFERVETLGNVVEVMDQSLPAYDFDLLQKENKANAIGLFIERIRGYENQDEVVQKALYYGMEALLNAKDR